MDIFAKAAKQKLRFASIRGELVTENLWDLPLTSKNGFDLDTVARNTKRELNSISEDSFVTTTTNPAKETLELKLEVLKFVIADKLQAASAAQQATKNAAERQRLLEVLHEKQNDELRGLTAEQIQARLAELG